MLLPKKKAWKTIMYSMHLSSICKRVYKSKLKIAFITYNLLLKIVAEKWNWMSFLLK